MGENDLILNVILAVDSERNALIVEYQREEEYDIFSGPWAGDNGFRNEPTEPGLYNCVVRGRWDSLDGFSDLGEMIFEVESAEKIAYFAEGLAIGTTSNCPSCQINLEAARSWRDAYKRLQTGIARYDKAPSEPGLYWYQERAMQKPVVIELFLRGEELCAVRAVGHRGPLDLSTMPGKWAGPIPDYLLVEDEEETQDDDA